MVSPRYPRVEPTYAGGAEYARRARVRVGEHDASKPAPTAHTPAAGAVVSARRRRGRREAGADGRSSPERTAEAGVASAPQRPDLFAARVSDRVLACFFLLPGRFWYCTTAGSPRSPGSILHSGRFFAPQSRLNSVFRTLLAPQARRAPPLRPLLAPQQRRRLVSILDPGPPLPLTRTLLAPHARLDSRSRTLLAPQARLDPAFWTLLF